MKVLQLASLFGGVASAVQTLVGRDDGTTTLVVYTTSTYTITECAASVISCAVASATEHFTSTTVVSVTATVCPGPSAPGLPSSLPGQVPPSSAIATSLPIVTNTLSDSVPTSFPPGVSSSAFAPPVQSTASPSGPLLSVGVSVSLGVPNPSLPVTGTDGIATSFLPGVSGPSSVYTPPNPTSALSVGFPGSDTLIVPQPSPSGSAPLTGSLTDSVPTSFPPGASAPGSSMSYDPPQLSATTRPASGLPTTGINTDAVPTSGVTPSNSLEQSSATSNTATDAVQTSFGPGPSDGPSSDAITPSVSSVPDASPTSGSPGSSVDASASIPHSLLPTTDFIPSYGVPPPSASPSSGAVTPSIATNTGSIPTSGAATIPGISQLPKSDSASAPASPSASSYTVTYILPTSGHSVSSTAPSSGPGSPSSPANTATDAVPTSGYPESSIPGSASHTGTVGTNTDSAPAPSGVSASELSSGGFYIPETTALPIQSTPGAPQNYSSGSVPITQSNSLTTASDGYPVVTATSSGFNYPGFSPSGSLSTDTATDAVPTSRGTGYLPSGSGSPQPSGANGTVVSPSPSYIEVPINVAQTIAVGQGPIAAIVIALAFALFA